MSVDPVALAGPGIPSPGGAGVPLQSVATPDVDRWTCETGFVSDLLVRCGREDDAALALLFDVLSPVVTASVSAAVEPPGVLECVKDVFLEVWRGAPDYRVGDGSPVAWIMDRVASVSSRPAYGRQVSGLGDA